MKGPRKEGSEFWTSTLCPAAQFGQSIRFPTECDGKGAYTWDPWVSAVGFVCAVTSLLANQETAVEAK